MSHRALVTCTLLLATFGVGAQPQNTAADWTSGLRQEVSTLGKPAWRPMLAYDIDLHAASTHPPEGPFQYPWEDTGRGYGYGPAFGHWDLVHEILDVLPLAPGHARDQLLNDVRLQLPSGFLPGLYWMREPKPSGSTSQSSGASPSSDPNLYDPSGERFSPTQGHPPLWVIAADDYMTQTGDQTLMPEFLDRATRQIGWFERDRRARPDGFLYLDIINQKWESGVDQGVRFDSVGKGGGRRRPTSTACVDATAHVYQMYVYAAKWSASLRKDPRPFQRRADQLQRFMQTRLWSERDGFFYDAWVLDRAPDGPREHWNGTPAPGRAHSFEGMWPMVVGAATLPQGRRVVDEWLMRKDRFFTPHPIATVAASDPKFGLRMWRGPVWNSMTYWAARAAVRYGRRDDAGRLLEAALDDSAAQFTRTGVIWEFYDPFGNRPEDLQRKPETKRNLPFPDYLGHNPLLAMARLWMQLHNP